MNQLKIRLNQDDDGHWLISVQVTFDGYSGVGEGYVSTEQIVEAAATLGRWPLASASNPLPEAGYYGGAPLTLKQRHVSLKPLQTDGVGYAALDVIVAKPGRGNGHLPATLKIQVPISYQQLKELSEALMKVQGEKTGEIALALNRD